MEENIKREVAALFQGKGDETILDYVSGVLSDENLFEDGSGTGEAVFEAVGPFLIDGGCCKDEAEAQEACKTLADKLSGRAANKAQQPAMRALQSGPVQLASADNKALLYDENQSASARQAAAEKEAAASLPQVSDKDKQRMEKLKAKEEAAARAAFEAHKARAEDAVRGAAPVIIRDPETGGTGGMGQRDLCLEKFDVSNGGKYLIQEGNLMLAFGRRYGLIGRNGTGKSTLLRAMAAHEIRGIPPQCQILHVEQEVAGEDCTVMEAILACDVERTNLMQEEQQILAKMASKEAQANGQQPQQPAEANGHAGAPAPTQQQHEQQQRKLDQQAVAPQGKAAKAQQQQQAKKKEQAKQGQKKQQQPEQSNPEESEDRDDAALAARLVDVYTRLEEIDAAGAESRAAHILSGLSFDNEMMHRPTKTFSGGWRMRVALARALFVEPDLLLLDEPTNHLDLHAVLWLEDYLCTWPKTLLIVSHAREFLNTVCTDILHLHSRKIKTYKGNYDVFVRTMSEHMRNAQKQAEAQTQKKQHIQAFIDRFRCNPNRASLVQSRIKALEKMADVPLVEQDSEYCFRFPDPGDTVNPPIIGFNDVSFGYPGGPTLFHNLNFGLTLESRLAIVGPNGIGKSTLLNLIAGILEPTFGLVQRNNKVRLAIFSQHHVDGMDLALSPLTMLQRSYPGVREEILRGHLGSFGLPQELAEKPMYQLSGGQKNRVVFAKMTWTKPHILLLDEPSNHLDIDACNALIEGLAMFKGGVLMVSHDQYLIESTVDELWLCENGTVSPWRGTFQEYKLRLKAQQKQAQQA